MLFTPMTAVEKVKISGEPKKSCGILPSMKSALGFHNDFLKKALTVSPLIWIMKYLLILLLALPVLSQAQDSCKLKKLTDPYTKQSKISTGFVPFVTDGGTVNVSIDATATD